MAEQITGGVSGAVRRATGAAGETLKTAGAAARGATGAASDVTGADAVERAGEQVQQAARRAGAAVQRAGGGGEQRTLLEELRAIVREAALEVLVPAARRATTEAALYAVKRGPNVARNMIAPRLDAAIESAGGPGAFAKGALSSVSGARSGMLEKVHRGGASRARPWRERPLPVEESVDVVGPLETAYDRFTDFDEYAEVLSRGETVGERPNERITWRRTDRVEATAVISFHRLSDRLTRVMVTYDRPPQGLLEKTTSLFRGAPRGLGADLMRFKAFVEMSDEVAEPKQEPEQRGDGPRADRSTNE
jgi:hypothetical protein